MTTAISLREGSANPTQQDISIDKFESALIKGNLKDLTSRERLDYYSSLCHSLGLNPLTKPFEYIEFQGRLTLYARKDCTEQLRKIHNISTRIVAREMTEGVYTVTAQAMMPNGRTDESIGAVSIEGLRGEARANCLMRAETKAKRRVTLSICGLGMLDEAEVESIPQARTWNEPALIETAIKPTQPNGSKNPNQATIKAVADILGIADRETLTALGTAAMENTFPGRKTSELNQAEFDGYLDQLCVMWGMAQGVFRADNHALNAFEKMIKDHGLINADILVVARLWQEDVKRRKSAKIEPEPELAEVPY